MVLTVSIIKNSTIIELVVFMVEEVMVEYSQIRIRVELCSRLCYSLFIVILYPSLHYILTAILVHRSGFGMVAKGDNVSSSWLNIQ